MVKKGVRDMSDREIAFRNKVSAAVCLAIAAFPVWGAPLDVGFDEDVVVKVPAGETRTQTEAVRQQGASHIIKTGDGTWSLPLTAFRQRDPFDIGVRGGTLALSKGNLAPTVAKPTAVLNRAALWISTMDDNGDRSSKLVVTNGTDGTSYVARWCDERETDVANPTFRYCVTDWSATNYCKAGMFGVDAVYMEREGKPAVYCNGYKSGKYLLIQRDGVFDEIVTIRDIFCVFAMVDTYGYLLANTKQNVPGSNYGFHNSYICEGPRGFDGNMPIWHNSNLVPGPSKTGWTFLDGAYIEDPGRTKMPRGMHLISVKSGRNDGFLGGFWGNQKYENRQGGDYLYETVVFTNELTAAERANVTQYLLQKWGLQPNAGLANGKVEVAPGTTVEIVSDSGDTLPNIAVSGGGTMVKTGSGTLEAATFKTFTGAVRVDGGSLLVPDAEMVGVTLTAGSAVQTATSGRKGLVLSTGSAAAGVSRVTGPGAVRVTEIDGTISKVGVDGGTLALAAPFKPSVNSLVAGEEAVITNGTGEAYTGSMWTTIDKLDPIYGWFITGETSDGGNIWAWQSQHPFGLQPYMASDNLRFFNLQGNCLIYTTTYLPRAGVYEMTFDICAREGFDRYMNTIQVGPSLGALTDIAAYKVQRGASAFSRVTYRLPYAEAGNYIFGIRGQTTGSMGEKGGGTLFDNVSLRFVSAVEDDSVWQIPNGDFEQLENVVSAQYSYSQYSISNTAACWTFDNDGMTGTTTDPYVGVMVNGFREQNNNYNNYYVATPGKPGYVHLFFANTNGAARTTFRPPAGTWRLRGDISILPMYWRGTDNWKWAQGTSYLDAAVTIAGVTTALGQRTVSSLNLQEGVWPTAFTVDGETDVTLELRQAASYYGSLAADNFVLVKADDDEELVRDGGFETAKQSTWDGAMTSDCWRSAQNNVGQKYSYVFPVSYGYNPSLLGYSKYEGTNYLIVVGTGSLEQDIAFPTSGIYRLTLHTADRRDNSGLGNNPLKASFYPQGGTTNQAVEIGTFRAWATNFAERVAYFRVSSAGNYTFRMEGTVTTKNSDRMIRVDGVSIRRVDESTFAAETPDVQASTSIELAAGAKLKLDFPGTLKLDGLRYAGRSYSGILTADNCPCLFGPGALDITPKGTVILFR